jgi:hypothetical protein
VDDVGNSEYLFEDECNGGEKKQVSVQGDEVTISYPYIGETVCQNGQRFSPFS